MKASYNEVRPQPRGGGATLDVFSFITGERSLEFLCFPCARERRANGGYAELTHDADKIYSPKNKCADCTKKKKKKKESGK